MGGYYIVEFDIRPAVDRLRKWKEEKVADEIFGFDSPHFKDPMTIVVWAWNRPEYLQRCLDSIANQTGITGDLIVEVRIDGVNNKFSGKKKTDGALVEACYQAAKSHPIVDNVIANEENLGIGIQQYQGYNHHYDRHVLHSGTRWITFIEDDAVLSPYYIRIHKLMLRFFDEDEHLFVVSSQFKRFCSRSMILENIDRVEYGRIHWVGLTVDIGRWLRLRTSFYEYYQHIKSIDYTERRHSEIRAWFTKRGWPHDVTSQDGGKDYALWKTGMTRLRTVVNRGFYIGEKGVHGHPGLYKRQRWEEEGIPYDFPADIWLRRLVLTSDEDHKTDPDLIWAYREGALLMRATDAFNKSVVKFIQPRARDEALKNLQSIWAEIEADARKEPEVVGPLRDRIVELESEVEMLRDKINNEPVFIPDPHEEKEEAHETDEG